MLIAYSTTRARHEYESMRGNARRHLSASSRVNVTHKRELALLFHHLVLRFTFEESRLCSISSLRRTGANGFHLVAR